MAVGLAGQTDQAPPKDDGAPAKSAPAKKSPAKKTAKTAGSPNSTAKAKNTSSKKTTASKTTALSQDKSGSSAKKSSSSHSSTARAKSSKSTKKLASKKAPRGQQRPTPERYKQIEEALASHGYLHEDPSGKWGPGSVDALRSFQADHQLPPTGRLDARSLIQLGLGPAQ